MTIAPLIAAVLILMIAMSFAWVVHRRTANAGWIDAIWTFAIGFAGLVAALAPIAHEASWRQWIVATLVGLWSIRLGLHLTQRNLKRPDDPRYAKMLLDWGADAARKLFWFLQSQAWCGGILVAAIFVAAWRPDPALLPTDILGALVFAGAAVGAAIADNQLRRFSADPANRGHVCETGLWRFSRHPNYFFEWLGWCAYPIIAIDPGGTYPWGWLALAAPALMYWLLVHVSGIPPLEDQMLTSRGAAFEAYRARTNAFFPWPRRRP